MKLSVILITWNSINDVASCIDSVLINTKNIDTEIIVVDNKSEDGTFEVLQSYGSKIRLEQNTKNLGVAKARNRALKMATGTYIWILDIDTIVTAEAVDGMVQHLDENKKTGICGVKLMSFNGEVQDSCRQLPALHYKFNNALLAILKKGPQIPSLIDKINRKNESQFYHEQMKGNEPFSVGYLIGACQMFRKEVLEKVGLLDEKIFYGPEDADFCLRVYQLGWGVVYLPQYHMIHHYTRITNKKIFSYFTFVHLKALIYYAWKHRKG